MSESAKSSTQPGERANPAPTAGADAKTLYKQGFACFARGESELAITRYREAIAVDARLAIAWNGLSLALAKQGRLDEAIEAAEELVRLEPDDPLSHTNLSRILVQKGLIPEAEDAKARAMSLQMQHRR